MGSEEKLYLEIGQQLPDAVQSQMFGKPCFKINGKAFVCFFNGCMVFKLSGDLHKKAISLSSALLFDPSGKGRPMKEWIQVPYSHKAKWLSFAQGAMAYVLTGS
jgi:hypothetical protein